MPGRFSADVIFCLDASGSMAPCFDSLRSHLGKFAGGLRSGGQMHWDLRLDFLAHRAQEEAGSGVFHFQSLRRSGMELIRELYQGLNAGESFFSPDVDEFQRGLGILQVKGDEASLVALDTCLDFPWRDASVCHRVVIMLTDEALETGVCVAEQVAKIDQLISKLHTLRIKLFLVGPESPAFDALCAADRSEYLIVTDGQAGLISVDFDQVLEVMGKSVSVSNLQAFPPEFEAKRGLFGQAQWRSTCVDFKES
jgi:hypothetical protein